VSPCVRKALSEKRAHTAGSAGDQHNSLPFHVRPPFQRQRPVWRLSPQRVQAKKARRVLGSRPRMARRVRELPISPRLSYQSNIFSRADAPGPASAAAAFGSTRSARIERPSTSPMMAGYLYAVMPPLRAQLEGPIEESVFRSTRLRLPRQRRDSPRVRTGSPRPGLRQDAAVYDPRPAAGEVLEEEGWVQERIFHAGGHRASSTGAFWAWFTRLLRIGWITDEKTNRFTPAFLGGGDKRPRRLRPRLVGTQERYRIPDRHPPCPAHAGWVL